MWRSRDWSTPATDRSRSYIYASAQHSREITESVGFGHNSRFEICTRHSPRTMRRECVMASWVWWCTRWCDQVRQILNRHRVESYMLLLRSVPSRWRIITLGAGAGSPQWSSIDLDKFIRWWSSYVEGASQMCLPEEPRAVNGEEGSR